MSVPLAIVPFHEEAITDYLENNSPIRVNDQLPHTLGEINIYTMMNSLRLDNPQLFPYFYNADKRRPFKGVCTSSGCLGKIRLKRHFLNNMNKHETPKVGFEQKINLLPDDGGIATDRIAREAVSFIIWDLYQYV